VAWNQEDASEVRLNIMAEADLTGTKEAPDLNVTFRVVYDDD